MITPVLRPRVVFYYLQVSDHKQQLTRTEYDLQSITKAITINCYNKLIKEIKITRRHRTKK